MRFTTATFAAVAVFFSLANAHQELIDPPPFRSQFNKGVAPGDIDFATMNAPLKPDGSNFPCKGYVDGTPAVKTLVPGKQTLRVRGGAVHGGGSCQVSLSYQDGKAGTFKVITSILGGCSASIPGNAADPLAEFDIPFILPDDAKAGDAILSWSWFNKIGNREMYQNCARVTIGGSGTSTLDSLPDMFVANVGNGCATVETFDTVFPDPGEAAFVINNGGKPGPPSGNCGSSGGAVPPVQSGSFSATVPGQNLVGTTTTIATAAPTTFAVVTTTAAAAPPPAATTTASPSAGTGGGDNSSGCVSGSVICQPGGKTWMMCGDTQKNVFAVPPGTVCNNGTFDYAVKRSLSHARRAHLKARSLHKHL